MKVLEFKKNQKSSNPSFNEKEFFKDLGILMMKHNVVKIYSEKGDESFIGFDKPTENGIGFEVYNMGIETIEIKPN